ncbi:cholesterol esterase [Coemansia sp. RSA 1286]|nr:cholesterol esterase [Coemansia sp. RSA 485]KAJ2602309.1 cholesterol esterase [Coemansia sp. RSA 1721]KAJ2640468.1 cholesterol esterase [Coemansia sp. RSA 1286]
MIYIPFFSRLSLTEYQGMLIAALFFIVEKFLRVFVVLFPIGYVVDAMPEWILSRLKVPQLTSANKEAELELLDDFRSFAEIMDFWDYPFEDHLVETRDGFVLGIHRITGPRKLSTAGAHGNDVGSQTEGGASQSSGRSGSKKPVVLFWHGFMLSSECFVCHPDWVNILPFRLAEAGYDVWLGNSRGNKYSYKHVKYAPSDARFWNFSIDEIANIDVPTTIDYILKETGIDSLTYIGFSQGTAQMFMALSRNRLLNQQVNHFIALAPASTPRGFHNSIVDYFIKATPHMLYLLFGRRKAMSLVYFWINILPRDLYVAALDFCVRLLFGWSMRNLSQETKCITYWHLYSYTSVKSIVHWMQIIRCGQLQMYDEDPPVYPLLWSSKPTPDMQVCGVQSRGKAKQRRGHAAGALAHWNNTYPLNKITTRVSLFHGGSDSLSSVELLVRDLHVEPNESLCFSHYEHMDFLWADSVGTLVHPKVLAVMGVHENVKKLPPLASIQYDRNGYGEEDGAVYDSTSPSEGFSLSDDEQQAHGIDEAEDCDPLPIAVVLPLKQDECVAANHSKSSHVRSASTLSRRRIVSVPAMSGSSSSELS